MNEEKETPPEETKRHFIWWGFILWPVIILLLYVLSAGPVLRLMEKKVIRPNQFWESYFLPLDWAYVDTPLHKPLGMYLHFWTDVYDNKGDVRIDKMK